MSNCNIEVMLSVSDENGMRTGELDGVSVGFGGEVLDLQTFYSDYTIPFRIATKSTILVDGFVYPAQMKGQCVGNVFWDTYEIPAWGLVNLVNHLMARNLMCCTCADSEIAEFVEQGRLTPELLHLAFVHSS